MRIKISSVDVNTDSINPSLRIRTDIEYYADKEFPILISGTIKIQGGKTIASLYEFQMHANDLIAINLVFNRNQPQGNRKRNYYAYFIAELTNKAIDYIEEMRERDKEKDVKLYFDFLIKRIETADEFNPQKFMTGSMEHLQMEIKSDNAFYTIKHSDWINKFAPQLGLGNFLLLDLQIPNENTVEDFWVELYNMLLENVNEMQSSIRAGDWQKTMFHARKFFDNLKIGDGKEAHKKFKEELQKLFIADQHDESGYTNFLNGVHQFFEFISKFAHDKDKKGVPKSRPIATKEDAYFSYALSVGLLNIIGKKTSKDTRY